MDDVIIIGDAYRSKRRNGGLSQRTDAGIAESNVTNEVEVIRL